MRAIQRIEEKHKFKLVSAEDAGEGALFMGSSTRSWVGSAVSPKLTEWIGTEMQKEAMVAKERRKAREERALQRKNNKDDADPEPSSCFQATCLLAVLFFFLCMSFGVGVGAADSHPRQRNIFPLPELRGDDGGGPSIDGTLFANHGIKALNEIAGCINSSDHTKKNTTRAQRRVLSFISDAYRETFTGSLEQSSSSRLYDSGRSDVLPYAKESISWPEVSSHPVRLLDVLSSAD